MQPNPGKSRDGPFARDWLYIEGVGNPVAGISEATRAKSAADEDPTGWSGAGSNQDLHSSSRAGYAPPIQGPVACRHDIGTFEQTANSIALASWAYYKRSRQRTLSVSPLQVALSIETETCRG